MFTTRTFTLTEDNYKTIEKWAKTHECSARLADGSPSLSISGGEISVTFNPSAVGTSITAKCICGKEIKVQM